MKMDKDSLIYGIEGQLRCLDVSKFIYNLNIDISSVNSPSDVSKIKSTVKKAIGLRFKGIVNELGLDSAWLSNILSADIVEGMGKLPVSSLKYLEEDIILALTNHCTNLMIPKMNFCILPYNTSINRFLILYLFTNYCNSEVRERLRAEYNNRICNTIAANNGISKASNTIKQVSVSDTDIKDKYKNFLKELGLTGEQDIIKRLLHKFISISYDENRKYFLSKILENNLKDVCFISYDKDYFGEKYYTIGIICGGYGNVVDRYNRERPYTDWEIWNIVYIFSFIVRKDGSVGFKADNIFCSTDTLRANLSDSSRIARYGSINKSFKAYMQELSDIVNIHRKTFDIGELLPKQKYDKFIKDILNASVLK